MVRTASTRTASPSKRGPNSTDPPSNAALIVQWLDENSVDYEYEPEFDVERVNFDESLRNQARLTQPLNEDRVELYAEQMENGDQFPPVVGYMARDRKLIFIDGNHRGQAWRLMDATTIPALVVKGLKAEDIVKLTFEANARHGVPNSTEERLEHAMHLVRAGYSQKNAALAMNLKTEDLHQAWRRSEADRRAASVGVKNNQWSAISPSARQRLDAVKNDSVFKKAVDIVDKLQLKSGDIGDLVSTINTKRTNKAQMEYLADFLEEHKGEIKRGSRGTRNLRYMLTTHVKGLIADLHREDFLENLTPQEAQEYSELLEEGKREIDLGLKTLTDFV